MSYKIFLSHNESDKHWIEWIRNHAQSIGINAYMYENDPEPGTLIAQKVQDAIDQVQALVVFITPNSQYSPYVQQEIGFAEAKGKLIIPIVQPGVAKNCLAMLEGREYISFDPLNPEMALSHLLEYLQQLKNTRENDQGILFGIGALVVLALLNRGKN